MLQCTVRRGGGTFASWVMPGLAMASMPTATLPGELMLYATVVLSPPAVTEVSPSFGSPAGGQTVTIAKRRPPAVAGAGRGH